MSSKVPQFEPHPLVPNGHWQTVLGLYLPGSLRAPASRPQDLTLEGGDGLRVLDSVPEGWGAGAPAVVLVHGLVGCARSPYMVRVAARLVGMGVRAVRMNLRGAGEGFGLARATYHAGRTGDLRAVMEWLAAQAPGSPIALMGFSLGGNLVLKLAAEATREPVSGLDCVLAANAPLDLSACCRHLARPGMRLYDRSFVRALRMQIHRLHARFPDLGQANLESVRSVYDFDQHYTAPRNGFRDAEDYYSRSSAGPLLGQVAVPGLVVHAEDDPFIPIASYRGFGFPPSLALELNPSGGHLGFISRSRWEGSRRWLDTRLATWLADRWRVLLRNPRGGLSAHVRPQTE